MQHGVSFIWLAGRSPAMIIPNLKIIPLNLDGDIPYLAADGLRTEGRDRPEIAAITGLWVDGCGSVRIDSSYLGSYMDAAPGPSGTSASETSTVGPHGKVKVRGGVTQGGGSTEVPSGGSLEEFTYSDDDPGAEIKKAVAQVLHSPLKKN